MMMTVCLSFVQDMENHDEDDDDSVSFFGLFCRMWRIMKMTVCISVQDVENDDNVCICAGRGE